MRKWVTSPLTTYRCGRCGDQIAADAKFIIITIAGVASALIRCEKCEGPAPPDLPARIEHLPPAGDDPLTLRGLLPLDWRSQRIAKEDK